MALDTLVRLEAVAKALKVATEYLDRFRHDFEKAARWEILKTALEGELEQLREYLIQDFQIEKKLRGK